MRKLLLIFMTASIMLAPLAAHARVGVVVAPRFGWGWYDPYWGPYPYGYYGYYGYDGASANGAVKFDTDVKDAEVFIDGAYAGTVGKLKTMYLRPGTYNFELRAPGRTQFDQKVYVVAGKTLHVNPNLHVLPQAQMQVQPQQ
jgi:hypothetical protein